MRVTIVWLLTCVITAECNLRHEDSSAQDTATKPSERKIFQVDRILEEMPRRSQSPASDEACDAHGNCVSGDAAKTVVPSELVADRRPLSMKDPWNRKTWRFAPIKVSEDYLVIEGELVMDRSEAPYMNKLAEVVANALGPSGRIMETGFGLGISARYIHQHAERIGKHINDHVIIEGNSEVFEKSLVPFSNNQTQVRPVFGFYQDFTNLLRSNSFDAILYDTYPLDKKDFHRTGACIHHRNIMKEAHRLLKPGGVFTYFANTNTMRGDKKRLVKAGFQEEDIQIETYEMKNITGDCKTYPYCKDVIARFQVPRVIKR